MAYKSYCLLMYLVSAFMIILILTVPSQSQKDVSDSKRKSKFWPATVVRFPNDICNSLEGYTGTCYTKRECQDIGGSGSGECANGLGKCCTFQASCGETATHNNTYFINSGYPNTISTSSTCTLTIKKCSSDICQVRLDFLNLNLAQPDGNGNCNTDSLIVSGSASNIPIICGENSGQHIYANFNGDSDITLIVSIGSLSSYSRSWNIKVTQLACDCPSLAPTGCLMYYTDLSGTVSSFNYGTTLSGSLVINSMNMTRPGTRQLANENYGVCVQMQPGYCSIQWSQGSDSTSFTVSNNTALTDVTPGLPGDPVSGTMCDTDFIVIPNPTYSNGTSAGTDRFCGNQLLTVTSASKPFIMTVVTDGNDANDVANRGFSLNYKQLACSAATIGLT